MWSTAASGMLRSSSTARRMSRACGSFSSIDSTPLGSASSSRLSTRSASLGACAAPAKALSTSPIRWLRGAVRWKAWPSRPGAWAMASSAAATKSTGTRLVWPSSGPTSGTHSGSQCRNRLMAVKK